MPQGARPQVVRPCGGRARRGPSHDLYDSGPRDGGFQSHTPSGPRFPHVVIASLQWDMAYMVFFLTLFQGK